MSITEFTVHNVLRTYTRQDRLGRLQKQRGAVQAANGDQVNLSPVAQKINLVGQAAHLVVNRKHPDADAENRQALLREETDRLMKEHRGEIESRVVSVQQFTDRLNQLYAE